ncbi:MAG: hypothetical protein Q9159_007123 [Coniocarpon cinnabarinum]
MKVYLEAHPEESKPPIPYHPGATFEARQHQPLPPPDERAPWPSQDFSQEKKSFHPLQLCLDHPLSSGSLGSGTVSLRIIEPIIVRDGRLAQVVKVAVSRDNGCSRELVAKFYDPLYHDFGPYSPEIFATNDAAYRYEVDTYQRLFSAWGTVVPRFHGSYSVNLPVERAGQQTQWRSVRLILMEHIEGTSLRDLLPCDYPQQERQAIMAAIITADSVLRKCNILHGDLYPRNVILLRNRPHDGGSSIRLIDFDCSLRNRLGAFERIPDILGPPHSVDALIRRWRYQMSDYKIKRFEDWIDFDWDPWLRTAFERRWHPLRLVSAVSSKLMDIHDRCPRRLLKYVGRDLLCHA